MAFLNKKNSILICLAACMMLGSCSSSEKKAQELYELAAFEQQQFNRENALKLYDRILAQYPDTETAKKAKADRESLLAKP
jgi:TolA-binding protein